ncbi:serine/threonine protein kinase [Pokkaliibacter plantistimulans]|uniref:Stress response kinase A n=1 Tax=Pokkaliibacter plantistimulans TaxID=1635171 RepID=A0ABX5LSN4_9GAMM|nr:serine/threonine protein kinase [Pokkaliibacter plantistimulans]PXF29649.1 serine/threonine protein kinase [Pokkaliibacter plantistimulans]
MTSTAHPYEALTPELVLDAVESTGLLSDARLFTLNSYENRVYQVGIEEHQPLIAKFYRPARWDDAAILEEHTFCQALQEQDLSVVAPATRAELEQRYSALPQPGDAGQTLFEHQGFRFSLFRRQGGQAPELDNPDHLFQLGMTIGRIHAVGAAQPYVARPALSVQRFGHDSRSFLLQSPLLPRHLRDRYDAISAQLLELIEQRFVQIGKVEWIRVHGDCHPGNVLWRDERPHFVDFDDSVMAPAVQDIWMLLSGDHQQQSLQLIELLEGYETFHDFDRRQLHLIDALRSLRLMHYSAWLARRWDDPAFPMHFPWLAREDYWQDHLNTLHLQILEMQNSRNEWLLQ